MKNIDEATYILGTRISSDRNSTTIYLDLKNYLEKVLKRFGT